MSRVPKKQGAKNAANLPKQPQEEEKQSLTETLIDEKRKSDQNIVVQSQRIQTELIEKADRQYADFMGVKSDVDTKLKKVLLMLAEIRQVVQSNMYSDELQAGFFTQAEAKYLACLDFKYVQLEALFQKDKTHWEQRINNLKKKAQGIKEQMQKFLEEQNRKLVEMIGLNASKQFKSGPKQPKFSLRKLPLWGKTKGSPFNFEWPTQVQLDTMPADVRLKSLHFKMVEYITSIGSVQVTLTHGFSSQVFEKQGRISIYDEKTLEIDAEQQIKRVQGADQNGTRSFVGGVQLMDMQGSKLGIFDPNNSVKRYPGQEHLLGDNEELIGVYGVMGLHDYFSAFGFIVRVKENN